MIKWLGSKKWVTNFINPVDEIYEPFAGSGAVSFSRSKKCYLNDKVPALIEVYKELKNNNKSFKAKVNQSFHDLQTSQDSKEEYYKLRGEFIKSGEKDPVLFLTLLYHGFNGLYRTGPNGFNVPYGGDRFPNTSFLDSIPIDKIQRLTCNNWYETKVPNETCTVYVDPPYTTTFTGYTNEGWDHLKDQNLIGFLKKLKNPVIISMLDTDDNRKLLQDNNFEFVIIPKTHSNGRKSKQVKEILGFNSAATGSIRFSEVSKKVF